MNTQGFVSYIFRTTLFLVTLLFVGCSLISGTDNTAKLLYHLNVGAEKNLTLNGQNWQGEMTETDRTVPWTISGGKLVSLEKSPKIQQTDIDPVYWTAREGRFSVSFSVPNGTYVAQLHFAETAEGVNERGARTFDVAVEDVGVLKKFDPYAAAGGKNTATVQTVDNIQVRDGSLDISLTEQSGQPLLQGISVYEK